MPEGCAVFPYGRFGLSRPGDRINVFVYNEDGVAIGGSAKAAGSDEATGQGQTGEKDKMMTKEKAARRKKIL